MKKILIFWLWNQGEKYVKYFSNKWFEIIWVSKSWLNKKKLKNISKIYKSEELFLDKNFNFSDFENIVLAVLPIKEHEKILEKILDINYFWKIFVEKPVSYDLEFLEKLKNYKNIYYFVDELYFSDFYEKIEKYNLVFVLYNHNNSEFIHLLEHIFWWFLLSENFENILQKLKIKFLKNKNEIDLKYNIIFEKNILFFERWDLFLNNKKILSTNFSKSLDFYLNLNENQNNLLQKNFYLMRKFINALQSNSPYHDCL